LLLVSIAVVLSGALLPYMSQAWEERDKERAKNQLNLAVKLTSVFFTACGVVILLRIWFSLMAIGQDYLWVAEKGKWASLALGVGLILNVVFNMILIPQFGLFGAVYATAIGNGAIVLIIFGANARFGCRPDFGIWACAAIPLLLLLGKTIAIVCVLALIVLVAKTNLILNQEEKAILLATIKEKLGDRFSSTS